MTESNLKIRNSGAGWRQKEAGGAQRRNKELPGGQDCRLGVGQESKAETLPHPSVSQGRMARGDLARQVEDRVYPRPSP